MLKAMLFIDYENFSIAKQNYYKNKEIENPKLDFKKFPLAINSRLNPQHVLVKTFLFVPKPDDFLIQNPHRAAVYNWIEKLKNQNHLSVIEGYHIARPTNSNDPNTMDINDPSSYNIIEKGTDINLAVHVLTKAFHNAFDTAIIMSADTDYLPIFETLNMMGKSVVIAVVDGQNIGKFKELSDAQIFLDDKFFNKCLLR